ncbi:GST-like protein [Novosphingobium sp. PC22D]|uniref:MAPEG family protein n=1 Tax=Novosphingobium sp. PC22D TaxID=1962403 RepID=UPI000BF1A67F|nr:MAPEG family protein [Novosphingobium sp. PC22D]PEQ13351.1 GST-like protein [Novosphingobium sp. PC22D]
MILQTTLSLTAAAVIINLWLIYRVLRLRVSLKVLHGDEGNPLLMQRMRAHANFIENTPLILILIGAIEMTGRGGRWIAFVGAAFLLARVIHALGMDSSKPNPLRAGGMLTTLLLSLGLAVVAILVALGVL